MSVYWYTIILVRCRAASASPADVLVGQPVGAGFLTACRGRFCSSAANFQPPGQGKGQIRGRPSKVAELTANLPARHCRALQPRRLGKVDPKSISLPLIAPRHFGTGVAELPLDVALVGLGGCGEAGPQRMPGEFLPPLGLGKVPPNPGGERGTLHQPGDVLVGQPVGPRLLAAARNPPEQRPMCDAAELTTTRGRWRKSNSRYWPHGQHERRKKPRRPLSSASTAARRDSHKLRIWNMSRPVTERQHCGGLALDAANTDFLMR